MRRWLSRTWFRIRLGHLARVYCAAFDCYHATFAFHRINGWRPGDPSKAPPDVLFAHDLMMAEFRRLYTAARGQPPPENYADPAVYEPSRLKREDLQLAKGSRA